jgi:amino acid transporter
LVCGAGPNGYVHHGETWTELPAFLNGFSVSLAIQLHENT